MALFRKKTTSVTPQDAGIPILQRAAGLLGGRTDGDRLVLPNSGATMRLELQDAQPAGGATIQLWVDHPNWDRTVFDVATGVSRDPEQALAMALANVELNVVHLIDHQTQRAPDETITTNWADREHRWSVWFGNVMTINASGVPPVETPAAGYWPLLRDGIMARLGNQKVTYVKVTAMWFGDTITPEVRFNNIVSTELTRVLRQHIESTWPPSANLMQKQLIWIVQDAATTQPYPHTADDIGRYIIAAGQILDGLWHEHPDDLPGRDYEIRLNEVVNDPDLVDEMRFLLPEIAAQLWFGDLPGLEAVNLTIGDKTQTVNVHQLACFAHLFNGLDNVWGKEVPEQTAREWVAVSSLRNLRQQVIDAGHEASVLSQVALATDVNPGYRLR